MRKFFKGITTMAAAAVVAASAAFFAGCDYKFTPLKGEVTGDVASQGGFVVEKGDYVYFINGVEAYASDNTYGTPVKGALMRIKTADIRAGKNTAETVIPSLMVAGDYTSGIYIYGDRVYYATPNTVGNTAGEVDNTVLSFRSAALNGADVREHFRVSDNATVYRYVSVGETVYIVYEEDGVLASYNTAAEKNTTLAEGVSAYVLNSTQKGDPYIYYTMTVTDGADTDDPTVYDGYNQVYRVRADATKSPYTFTWDETYLEEHDGEAPYHNFGELVLDGISASDKKTQFNHDVDEENENRDVYRYTYTLQAYTNDGIYFVREQQPATASQGATGELYYLATAKIDAEEWNAVDGNDVYTAANKAGSLEVVANATDTGDASSAAYFYIDEDAATGVKHHYLYVNGSSIYRADVVNDGEGTRAAIGEGGTTALRIARDATDATLVSLASDGTYGYVYYTKTNGSGLSVERAVYSGDAEDYRGITAFGENNSPYKAVKVLNIEHASGWYNYEIVDNILFYANAEAFGETSYNYVWTVDLAGDDGALMNNEQLAALNEKYNDLTDADDGYFAKLSADGEGKLSGLVEYYFYTGGRTAVDENIEESVENGKSETYLYSEDELADFAAYIAGEGDAAAYKDEKGTAYTTLSYFTTRIGAVSEADEDAFHDYWRSTLQRYSVTEEDEALPVWAWVLIGVGIAVVVAAAVVLPVVIVRSRKKKAAAPRAERMAVDTTDDKDVDVYAVSDEAHTQAVEPEEAPAEEPAEKSSEVPEEAAQEAPAEEPSEASEEAAEEAPAAEPSEQDKQE